MIIPLNSPQKFARGVLDIIDIAGEGDTLHLNYFVVRQDLWGLRLLSKLKNAALRGVECTLIVDSWGSLQPAGHGTEYESLPLTKEVLESLEGSGVEVLVFHHVENLNMLSVKNLMNWQNFSRRNHNKNFLFHLKRLDKRGLVIGDSQWTDGHFGALFRGNNIYIENERIYEQALDYVLRIKNSSHVQKGSVVQSLCSSELNLQDVKEEEWQVASDYESLPWLSSKYQVHPESIEFVASEIDFSDPWKRHTIQHYEIELMLKARSDIWYSTPYFSPDREMQEAFICAQKHDHVELNILIAKFRNHPFLPYGTRRAAQQLLKHSVNIFEYMGYGNIHYKDLIVDDISFIKTANGEGRSRFYNLETGVIVKSAKYARINRRHILSDIQKSSKLTAKDQVVEEKGTLTRLWKESLCPLYYKHL